MSYTVYGALRSRAFRVLWLLEELGVSYTHVPAGAHAEEVRAISPLGKVPVLLDGDRAIPDSMAILTYLADKHGRFTKPAGTPERARQDAWTFRVLDDVESLLWTAARHSFVLPEADRVPQIIEACRKEYAQNISRIFDEVDGPYLMGEELLIPDILLCHCGNWAQSAKFPEAPAPFASYLANLRGRDAYRRTMALS
jgi:glutathione S-transferase